METKTIPTKRKAYVREVKANWWQVNTFYKMYMLREATSIPMLWFAIVLLYGVICIAEASIVAKGDATLIVAALKSGYFAFLHNPLVILLNIIALVAVVINTFTWFNLTPKAINVIYKNAKLSESFINKVMWAITIVATIVTFILIVM